jgi:hypothetical protein
MISPPIKIYYPAKITLIWYVAELQPVTCFLFAVWFTRSCRGHNPCSMRGLWTRSQRCWSQLISVQIWDRGKPQKKLSGYGKIQTQGIQNTGQECQLAHHDIQMHSATSLILMVRDMFLQSRQISAAASDTAHDCARQPFRVASHRSFSDIIVVLFSTIFLNDMVTTVLQTETKYFLCCSCHAHNVKNYIITPTLLPVTNKRILVKDTSYNPTCFGALRYHHQGENKKHWTIKH